MAIDQDHVSQKLMSDRGLALAVYALYAAGYVVGFSAIVGVIIAHVKVHDADPELASHFRFQIRTFWIGLLYMVVGLLLCLIFIGVFILIWWFIWSVVRIVKGMLALNDDRPIDDPGSWLFG
jgi:uncharacterized membrane protein